MADYIDRAKLVAELQDDSNWDSSQYMRDFRNRMLEVLKEQPAVDAKPEKHGFWQCVYEANSGAKVGWCSECGFSKEVDNYCSNCGAKMDLGDMDND